MNLDTAIYHSRITSLLTSKISKAALHNGLPESSVPALFLGLSSGAPHQLASIPGITPTIIDAAARALKEAYPESFRSVWIAASCLAACGLIGRFTRTRFTGSPANTRNQFLCSSPTPPRISTTTSTILPSLRRLCMARNESQ